MNTDFLQLALEILQLPIILLIVIFCHRTSGVLKFSQMNFIAVAFGLNFIYMLFIILNSDVTRMFVSGRIYKLDISYLIELVDLATFSFFPITCYYFFNKDNSMRSESYPFKKHIDRLFCTQFSMFLVFGLIIICFASFLYDYRGSVYIVLSAFFKAISILSLMFFFFSLKSYYVNTRYYVLIGLSIWLLLQFTSVLNENFVKEYSYIFFSFSAITKILIAVSIFKNPLILEKIQSQKEKADEFRNILSVALHEINTPLESMDRVLSNLVKSEQPKGKSFLQLDSDYEKLRLIVDDTEEAFRGATQENIALFTGFKIRKKTKSIINLNKVVHKCVMIIKNNYEANSLDIEVTFGKEVHAFANESEVEQIILNIIKNAVEAYQPNDAKKVHIVTDNIKYKDQEDKMPIVRIEDFAEGIPKEIEEHIWVQGFSTKTRISTSIKGQGLHISKELAERNAVDINFISSRIDSRRKEMGTIFTIKFTKDKYE
jgi:signal transduction histidine kinase